MVTKRERIAGKIEIILKSLFIDEGLRSSNELPLTWKTHIEGQNLHQIFDEHVDLKAREFEKSKREGKKVEALLAFWELRDLIQRKTYHE